MSRYRTIDALYSKIDWEGGLMEAAFGYGIKADWIDKEALPELHEAWLQMESAYELFRPTFERVQALLDD